MKRTAMVGGLALCGILTGCGLAGLNASSSSPPQVNANSVACRIGTNSDGTWNVNVTVRNDGGQVLKVGGMTVTVADRNGSELGSVIGWPGTLDTQGYAYVSPGQAITYTLLDASGQPVAPPGGYNPNAGNNYPITDSSASGTGQLPVSCEVISP